VCDALGSGEGHQMPFYEKLKRAPGEYMRKHITRIAQDKDETIEFP